MIVPVCMRAMSKCFFAQPHYLVCCINKCEEEMCYIEDARDRYSSGFGEDTLLVAVKLTNGDNERAEIDVSLRSQLSRMASTHGGKVPLHGRFSAQWLHYAFPRECPFPYKTGTAAARTPMQFGKSFAVSQEEVIQHLAKKGSRKTRKQWR